MKLYYLCPHAATASLPCPWHGIDLENGMWLIGVQWRNDAEETIFAARPDVLSLPHPIFGAGDKLETEHIGHLEKRMPIKSGHTVHDVIREGSKISPMLKLRVL